MTANQQVAVVNDIVHILTNCSQTCRNLTASPTFDVAREHLLPGVQKLVRLVNDCAASCDIAVLLIERKSEIIAEFLQVCEELAMECAWECSKYGFDLCKQCSLSCEQVAKACLPFIDERL